ncbi:hypothetical protein FIU87_08265 [Bacillus sp. THAF10]|uniref:FixH family protein n=1 Tax=Bacillus sp. THAF10 TaxID=2587848 RepID=UPI001269860C|nr:FixH family protein [Bacillus sp. THAF10]QFT88634.1 hypothetical protein FIU87_08265 [Bacillus sp. THAF10]
MKKLLLVFILAFLLVGCTSAPEKNTSPEIIEVEISMPEKVSENESVTIQTHVTQGEENVEDAKEVKFEIWNVEEGKEESTLLDAVHTSDGQYVADHSFREKGVYRVQSHVTARDLHVMPTKQIVVGELSEEDIQAILEKEKVNKEEENSEHDHH